LWHLLRTISEINKRIFTSILAKRLEDDLEIGTSFFECQACRTIAKKEPQQERFSKLENKEPAFIRKAKEQDSDLDK
jgi:hypothetical protein